MTKVCGDDHHRAPDLVDMWLDLAEALDEIEDWCSRESGSTMSLIDSCARPLHTATSLGRLGLIGLAS